MNNSKNSYFYLTLGAFFLGIFFSSFTFLPFRILLYTIIVLGLFTFVVYKNKLNKPRYIIEFTCLLLVLVLGFLHSQYYLSKKVGEFEENIETRISLSGYIANEPDKRDFNTRLVFKPDATENTKIILKTTPYPEYQYGDLITVTGKLKRPENFEGENGREFDYVNFLKKDNIFYLIDWPEIEKIGDGGGNIIKRKLFQIKKKFLDQTKKILPEPHSSFLGGLILGAKDSMGESLQEDFRKTGVIHIVVLSGFNVTIVADFMVKFFSFLGYTASGVMGGIAIVLFAIMTGASATIIRASIMAILVILAKLTSRYSEITRALFLAAFFMLIFNPMLLVYDPSFQLSFLASLGLIKLSPYIERKSKFIPEGKLDLRALFAASISTQIFVLPFLIWMMGEVSVVSPLVNLLVLVTVPPVMLLGFLMNIFSFIYFDLGFLLSIPVYFLLDYSLEIVNIFAKVPFASFQVFSFSFVFVVLAYLIYFLIWLRRKRRLDPTL